MNYSIDQAQNLRKEGFNIVTNKNCTKVIFVSKNIEEVEAKHKEGKTKIWFKLEKMKWTKADTKRALEELAMGLQCNI